MSDHSSHKKIGKWKSDMVLSLQTDIQRNKL